MAHEKNDHVIMEVVKDQKARTGHSIRVTKPSDVLRIHDVRELKAQLEHYSHPFIQHVVQPNTEWNRRWYVEKVRPALRYYCKKFSVKVPEWLKDEAYFHEMDEHERTKLFGSAPLAKREFRPLVKPTPDPAPEEQPQ